jgi:cytochrome c
MDSFELNKIMGAVLGTLLFVMGAGFVAEAIYHPIENRGPGYDLPEPEVAEAGGAEEAAPAVPLGVLLASASAERGATAVKKCASCHNFNEGGANKQGPGLYGVVGRLEGSHEGFAYSDGMLAHNAAGDTWTYENLDHFLTKPSDYVPGTKMNFAGVRTPEERADILAYLQTLSATPVPFPAAEEAAPADAAAPAEGEAAPVETAPAAEPAAAPAAEPAAAPAAEPAAAPAAETAPAATETPTTTPTETPVEGTPAPGATTPAPATN